MNPLVEMGKTFKSWRREAKLSQSHVSEKLGFKGPQFISKFETGKEVIPTVYFPILAELYNTPVETMFTVYLDCYKKLGCIKLGIDYRRVG